jgi:outer membrane protein OmpA-like peptidoglycan-associated protein
MRHSHQHRQWEALKMLKQSFACSVVALISLTLTTAGCATKSFVRAETGVVNGRVSQVQNELNTKLDALASKHNTDISRVEERITTTDNTVASVASTAEQARSGATQANATATQALSTAQDNANKIKAVEAAQKLVLSGTENVMFATDKSNLTDAAKTTLDAVVQKGNSVPGTTFEVVGFTDDTGGPNYNLGLSERRAEEVARYLIKQSVAMKDISFIGLGEDQTPEQLAAEVKDMNPNATEKEQRAMARRVRIRLYVPGSSPSAVASR